MSNDKRPNWQDYFMTIAEITASRATCPRAKVGAVIVKNNQLLVSGYNGAVSGHKHCTDVGCHIENNHCMRAVHAEMNAICNSAKQGDNCEGADLYVTHFPCIRCMPLVLQAGIKTIYYLNDYNNNDFCKELALESGTKLIKMDSTLKQVIRSI